MPGQIPVCGHQLVISQLQRAELAHATEAAAADRARAEAEAAARCSCHDWRVFGHGTNCRLGLGPATRGGPRPPAALGSCASSETYDPGRPGPAELAAGLLPPWPPRPRRPGRWGWW